MTGADHIWGFPLDCGPRGSDLYHWLMSDPPAIWPACTDLEVRYRSRCGLRAGDNTTLATISGDLLDPWDWLCRTCRRLGGEIKS